MANELNGHALSVHHTIFTMMAIHSALVCDSLVCLIHVFDRTLAEQLTKAYCTQAC